MNNFWWLVEQIRRDFPDLKLKEGRRFAFRPPKTIILVAEAAQPRATMTNAAREAISTATERLACLRLLHEVGHADLRHRDFATDVERLKMECAAWERARELAERYGVDYDEELAEAELDSYREWLHQRSRCPRCGLTRCQKPDGKYYCPGCDWGSA